MNSLDQSIFLAMNHALKSNVNDYWLGYATWLGNGWVGFPIAIIALILIDRKSFWNNLIVLAIAGIIGGIVLNILKDIFYAPRPLTVFAADITAGKVCVNVLFDRLYWNSFPSGHSQTAFSIATVLAWAVRRKYTPSRKREGSSYIIFAIATLVPISRIYCGAHFPSDVIAGAMLGAFIAYASIVGYNRVLVRRAQKRHLEIVPETA